MFIAITGRLFEYAFSNIFCESVLQHPASYVYSMRAKFGAAVQLFSSGTQLTECVRARGLS